jgi:hypothetical protein
MNSKRFLFALTVIVAFACPTFAQFGSSNRLTDLAGRLSRDAGDFADANYRTYTSTNRYNRTDVEAVLLTQQFAGASQIFYRMVVDGRRTQELRDAYDLLQNLGRSVERNNLNRSQWYGIQRSLSDVGREIGNYGGGGDQGYPGPGGGGSGRMTWKGRVDDDIRITIRGGTADVETIGGSPYSDGQPNFSASLPSRRVNVTINVKRGRGQVYIEQQPSRDNSFAAVIRIKDPKGGASDYEFELSW